MPADAGRGDPIYTHLPYTSLTPQTHAMIRLDTRNPPTATLTDARSVFSLMRRYPSYILTPLVAFRHHATFGWNEVAPATSKILEEVSYVTKKAMFLRSVSHLDFSLLSSSCLTFT